MARWLHRAIPVRPDTESRFGTDRKNGAGSEEVGALFLTVALRLRIPNGIGRGTWYEKKEAAIFRGSGKKSYFWGTGMKESTSKKRSSGLGMGVLAPVLAGFFVMGFCDLVAPVSGRIAADYPASTQGAVSFLPTMVFLWFLVLSIPVARLMNRIGRRPTALLGYLFTAVGMLLPYAAGARPPLGWYFVGFGLLGIGNTAVQVAVNPLLAAIAPVGRMTSYLTVGQVFRNTSLLIMAPLLTALVAATGSWRLLLPLYAAATVAAGLWLWRTPVPEPGRGGRTFGFVDCFRLLRNPRVALSAFGVAAFIAADVGIGFLSSRLLASPDSILTTTGFYACRIVGTLVGAWALTRCGDVVYLRWNLCGALLLAVALLLVRSDAAIYLLVGLLGFALACVFATFYAVATRSEPARIDAVAGLLILMIAAGAVPGPVIGAIVRAAGDVHAGLYFVLACLAYQVWASFRLGTKHGGDDSETDAKN